MKNLGIENNNKTIPLTLMIPTEVKKKNKLSYMCHIYFVK